MTAPAFAQQRARNLLAEEFSVAKAASTTAVRTTDLAARRAPATIANLPQRLSEHLAASRGQATDIAAEADAEIETRKDEAPADEAPPQPIAGIVQRAVATVTGNVTKAARVAIARPGRRSRAKGGIGTDDADAQATTDDEPSASEVSLAATAEFPPSLPWPDVLQNVPLTPERLAMLGDIAELLQASRSLPAHSADPDISLVRSALVATPVFASTSAALGASWSMASPYAEFSGRWGDIATAIDRARKVADNLRGIFAVVDDVLMVAALLAKIFRQIELPVRALASCSKLVGTACQGVSSMYTLVLQGMVAAKFRELKGSNDPARKAAIAKLLLRESKTTVSAAADLGATSIKYGLLKAKTNANYHRVAQAVRKLGQRIANTRPVRAVLGVYGKVRAVGHKVKQHLNAAARWGIDKAHKAGTALLATRLGRPIGAAIDVGRAKLRAIQERSAARIDQLDPRWAHADDWATTRLRFNSEGVRQHMQPMGTLHQLEARAKHLRRHEAALLAYKPHRIGGRAGQRGQRQKRAALAQLHDEQAVLVPELARLTASNPRADTLWDSYAKGLNKQAKAGLLAPTPGAQQQTEPEPPAQPLERSIEPSDASDATDRYDEESTRQLDATASAANEPSALNADHGDCGYDAGAMASASASADEGNEAEALASEPGHADASSSTSPLPRDLEWTPQALAQAVAANSQLPQLERQTNLYLAFQRDALKNAQRVGRTAAHLARIDAQRRAMLENNRREAADTELVLGENRAAVGTTTQSADELADKQRRAADHSMSDPDIPEVPRKSWWQRVLAKVRDYARRAAQATIGRVQAWLSNIVVELCGGVPASEVAAMAQAGHGTQVAAEQQLLSCHKASTEADARSAQLAEITNHTERAATSDALQARAAIADALDLRQQLRTTACALPEQVDSGASYITAISAEYGADDSGATPSVVASGETSDAAATADDADGHEALPRPADPPA